MGHAVRLGDIGIAIFGGPQLIADGVGDGLNSQGVGGQPMTGGTTQYQRCSFMRLVVQMAVVIEAIDIVAVVQVNLLVDPAQAFFITLMGDQVDTGAMALFKLEAEDGTVLGIYALRQQRLIPAQTSQRGGIKRVTGIVIPQVQTPAGIVAVGALVVEQYFGIGGDVCRIFEGTT